MATSTLAQVRLIADRFVRWQNAFGKPDPDTCPFVTTGYPFGPTHLHSPTFLAIALYNAYEITEEKPYRDTADRYLTFFFSCLRNPQFDRANRELHWFSRPWMFGMGLAAYRDFKRHHPEEVALDGKAGALFDWMLEFRWDQGSYFRNGYGAPEKGIVDAANSDDNCHMGRGLVAYYQVTGRQEVLKEAEGLAGYYLTEVKPGGYDGCWSSKLGTWVVAPTIADRFEHFEGVRSCDMGWGFSSVGAIEYLTSLYGVTQSQDLKARIPDKCVASMKWQFDACQFEDGACGMHGRDDKWLGMTAGAILSFLRTREAGFLNGDAVARYRAKALLARDWLLEHTTEENVDSGGYFKVTGQSTPRPPENLAWLLAWVIQALLRVEEI